MVVLFGGPYLEDHANHGVEALDVPRGVVPWRQRELDLNLGLLVFFVPVYRYFA